MKYFHKLMENILSIKVWVIFTNMAITTLLVWNGKITGDAFAAMNGGIISTVLAIREGVKVVKIHSPDDSKDIGV